MERGKYGLVEQHMSSNVRTIGRNENLALADETMTKYRIRHLVVVDDDGAVEGIISSRDLFKGALAGALGYGTHAQRKTLESLLAKEVMSSDVVTIRPDAPLEQAASLMATRKLGCLPVVDCGNLVGILTEGDFVALVAESVETRDHSRVAR